MYKWVPPGIYDHQEEQVRRLIVEGGRPKIVIAKMWLDQGGPEDVDPALKLPWGTYPNFPPKPPSPYK